MESNNPTANSKDILPEERLDTLADVLAEGFLYLAEHNLLNFDSESPHSDLIVPLEEGKVSNVPKSL
jgi:hypothetical protein